MGLIETVRYHVLPYWKTYVLLLLPLVLLPLLVNSDGGKEGPAGYVIIIMAVYWMTEALPLAVTSLLPVVLFPLLGVMDTGKVCVAYMKETNMMFIGGLIVALAIEYCNLHRRIALRVLLLVGASPRWLMLGFMLTTMFLSMWISNTATTAMMVPIVQAVIAEIYKNDEEEMRKETNIHMAPDGSSTDSSCSTFDVDLSSDSGRQSTPGSIDSVADIGKSYQEQTNKSTSESQGFKSSSSANSPDSKERIQQCVLISIAYASNIGGTGSLIGSNPQLALKGIVQELYGSNLGLNFASWMGFNVPGMLINTFLAWIWLQFLFLGFKQNSTKENDRSSMVKKLIQRKYDELGAMTFHEIATLILFILCVLLWFFRDPQFITGWAELIPAVEIDDATAVLTIVLLLFIIPAQPKFWSRQEKDAKPGRSLIDWNYVQDRLPWGIVLLLGGGFALSDASKVSGLSKWLAQQLSGLSVLPPFAIMLIICIMTATITEVASNTATANILLPVLADLAKTVKVNPLYFMLPATVTCSYAFCLPVGTFSNAIVFASGKMKPMEMIKAGFIMNILCVLVICLLMVSFGGVIFEFEEMVDDEF